MSRAYRLLIPIAQINASPRQGIVLEIDLLPILPPEQMNELLARAIKQRGASERDGKLVLRDDRGVELHVDVDKRELSVRIDALSDSTVELWIDEEALSRELLQRAEHGTIEVQEDDDLGVVAEYARTVAKRDRDDLQRTLIRETHRARQELNHILKDVYRDAVKEKARSMGNVTSITESEHDGEYRIRIELEG